MARLTIYRDCCAYVAVGGEYGAGDGTMVQSDWDYPSLAQSAGWSLARVQRRHGRTVAMARINRARLADGCDCDHSGTDGTVDCPECGITAGAFIKAANDFLSERAQCQ